MRNMKELIPEKLNKLASECRATLYVVGGVCRDVLAGLEPANYNHKKEMVKNNERIDTSVKELCEGGDNTKGKIWNNEESKVRWVATEKWETEELEGDNTKDKLEREQDYTESEVEEIASGLGKRGDNIKELRLGLEAVKENEGANGTAKKLGERGDNTKGLRLEVEAVKENEGANGTAKKLGERGDNTKEEEKDSADDRKEKVTKDLENGIKGDNIKELALELEERKEEGKVTVNERGTIEEKGTINERGTIEGKGTVNEEGDLDGKEITKEITKENTKVKRDWDICAGVEPDEVIVLAERLGMVATAVYRNTGTVKLSDGENDYEFTSFRSDTYVRGVHQPVETTFTTDIVQDAKRRDFKANAVYYDIKNDTFVDPLGGIADIIARRMTTVRETERVFGEDGLRLMRLARQCAMLGFTPSDECLAGAKANAVLIADISAERIWAEMNAILHADGKYGIPDAPYRGLHLLRDMGVLAHILPELTLGDGMEQRRDYHNYDVLEHSFRCVKYARSDIRLAALLHDVGKPACKLSTGKFAEHELVGEKIAREVLTRWKVGKKLTDETCRLVRWHMYDFNGCTRQNKVRRVIVENLDIFDKLLVLKQADFSACKDNLSEAPIVTRWRAIYTAMQVEGVPLCLKQLAVRGDELIKQGIPPEKVGKILQQLLWECVQSSLHNDRDSLIKRAKQLGEI